ncbi:Alpha-1,3-mannosyltransferase-like protein [Coemansia sp. RSA 1722]|nr:Alpha-1,3-mannosyltransferase-like protein [Coemansia sp. RSA 486]KAJ2236309.1 Alpha-1,3-mannosyltransferase-like protein [Coemansia sp. RSA 485]KAJ2604740.1 Alpha-1,3-mannosyltransferase-like protein [Coemansia sp. RSA 1722]
MPTEQKQLRRLTIAFVHPNLGIGGAERLVVDAAASLQKRGHRVVVYTMHHDINHCFEETRDGTLDVRVGGGWLVPRSIFGRLHIACTTLRGLALARQVANDNEQFDVVFVDQLAATIPLLRFTRARIFFYCHFPDYLQARHDGLWRRIYRMPFDLLEQATTGEADEVAVNSRFTQEVFRQAFPLLSRVPRVLLPPLNLAAYDRPVDVDDAALVGLRTHKRAILSINRFERRKDIGLAVDAVAQCIRERSDVCLFVAGGWDRDEPENIACLRELVAQADALGLRTLTVAPVGLRADARAQLLPPNTISAPLVVTAGSNVDAEDLADVDVVFVPSFSDNQRAHLLTQATCVVYTPSNEHLGIVPLEAMYMRVPVVAVDSGGPRETVVHGKTGFLCEPTADAFAEAIGAVLDMDEARRTAMGEAGRERVAKAHDLQSFGEQLERLLAGTLEREPNAPMVLGVLLTLFILCTSVTIYMLASVV